MRNSVKDLELDGLCIVCEWYPCVPVGYNECPRTSTRVGQLDLDVVIFLNEEKSKVKRRDLT